ncbi:MAG: hypothetical protein WC121_11995 [Candidatus Kapaibacterium sp.]|jgi:hypothetical protein
MNAKDEQIAFSEWFDDLWLGDLEHGQHIPTIHDSGYDEYLGARQIALGAWMHRAQIASTNVSVEKSWRRFEAKMIELEREKTIDAAPTPPEQQDDEALEVLRLVLDALVWEVGSEPALCAGQTRRAIERARALLAKRGEK